MHIRALYGQSQWANQIAALNALRPLSASGATATTGTSQSGVAAVGDDESFSNLILALIRQQTPTQASSSGSTGSSIGIADGLRPGGLEGRIQSLADALGGSMSPTQLAGLTTTFKQLMSGLGDSGTASVSGQGASLTLESVLQGMLQNIRQQGVPASTIGQIVDTYA
jgi:hypothetical protein